MIAAIDVMYGGPFHKQGSGQLQPIGCMFMRVYREIYVLSRRGLHCCGCMRCCTDPQERQMSNQNPQKPDYLYAESAELLTRYPNFSRSCSSMLILFSRSSAVSHFALNNLPFSHILFSWLSHTQKAPHNPTSSVRS
jgi:hypothetical protein